MEAVTLSGVVFSGFGLSTELKKPNFTVRLAAGVVTKGLSSEHMDLQINVSGHLKFKVAAVGRTTIPKPTDLTSLEGGTLKFSATAKDKITLKLTLPKRSSPSDGIFKYHVMKATGAYTKTKGSGDVSFITLFPTAFLADISSEKFAGSLIPA
jgi:hypothetical protein